MMTSREFCVPYNMVHKIHVFEKIITTGPGRTEPCVVLNGSRIFPRKILRCRTVRREKKT